MSQKVVFSHTITLEWPERHLLQDLLMKVRAMLKASRQEIDTTWHVYSVSAELYLVSSKCFLHCGCATDGMIPQ